MVVSLDELARRAKLKPHVLRDVIARLGARIITERIQGELREFVDEDELKLLLYDGDDDTL